MKVESSSGCRQELPGFLSNEGEKEREKNSPYYAGAFGLGGWKIKKMWRTRLNKINKI